MSENTDNLTEQTGEAAAAAYTPEREKLIAAAERASKVKADFDVAMRRQKILALPALTKEYAAIVSGLSDQSGDEYDNSSRAGLEKAMNRVAGPQWRELSEEELAALLDKQADAWTVMSSRYLDKYGKASHGNALYVFAERAGVIAPEQSADGVKYPKLNAKKNMEALKKETALPEKIILQYDENLRKKRTALGETLSWIFTILSVVVIVALLRTFIFEPIRVDGKSMTNTLPDDGIVYSSKLDYRLGDIERGDVVICHYPGRTDKILFGLITEQTRFVKRVVALPGDTIEIRAELEEMEGSQRKIYTVFVNGEAYKNPENVASVIRGQSEWLRQNGTPSDEGITYTNIYTGMQLFEPAYYSYTLGEDEYFVIGDNRADSHDSRAADVGPITRDMIVGKVRFILWPLSQFGPVKSEAELR